MPATAYVGGSVVWLPPLALEPAGIQERRRNGDCLTIRAVADSRVPSLGQLSRSQSRIIMAQVARERGNPSIASHKEASGRRNARKEITDEMIAAGCAVLAWELPQQDFFLSRDDARAIVIEVYAAMTEARL